jgi:hypothetical protein
VVGPSLLPLLTDCSLGDISVDMVSEMEATNKELAELEVELEKKKEALQKQIFNACDASERSSSSLDTIQIEEVPSPPPSLTDSLVVVDRELGPKK